MVNRLLLAGLIAFAAAADTKLHYKVEWRLVHAGNVTLNWQPKETAKAGEAHLHLESTGLVSRLYKVNNNYQVRMADGFCAMSSGMQVEEGSRRREIVSTYDRERKKAFYIERDLTKNAVLTEKETDLPLPCVHEVIGGLMQLRELKIEIGQSATIPVSDGKKFAHVKVEAQAKEVIQTPTGRFPATRYEIFLMNNVVYARSGRVFVWLTEDERRLPVQIRVRLQLLIGTITLQLMKEERQ